MNGWTPLLGLPQRNAAAVCGGETTTESAPNHPYTGDSVPWPRRRHWMRKAPRSTRHRIFYFAFRGVGGKSLALPDFGVGAVPSFGAGSPLWCFPGPAFGPWHSSAGPLAFLSVFESGASLALAVLSLAPGVGDDVELVSSSVAPLPSAIAGMAKPAARPTTAAPAETREPLARVAASDADCGSQDKRLPSRMRRPASEARSCHRQ